MWIKYRDATYNVDKFDYFEWDGEKHIFLKNYDGGGCKIAYGIKLFFDAIEQAERCYYQMNKSVAYSFLDLDAILEEEEDEDVD